MPAVPAPTPARPLRFLAVGVRPDLDALAAAINRHAMHADEVVLVAIPGDSASDAARSMWSGHGWTVEPVHDLPDIPIVASLRLDELAPDVVLVCQPLGSRDPLAAAMRGQAHRLGITVEELPRA